MSGNVISREENAVAFSDFDREFGNFLLRYAGNRAPELLAVGMLLARELRDGRTKIDLNEFAGTELILPENKKFVLPDAGSWLHTLTSPGMNGVVTAAGDDDRRSLIAVLDGHIVMLRRYLEYENDIASLLIARKRFNTELVCDFPGGGDWMQDLAVFTALNSSLTVLSGGPGTGKTTVCGRIIREILLREPDKNILFAAPTGKAQQRLAVQISDSAELLEHDSEAYRAMKAIEGTTIHSYRYNRFWREKLNFCDLLIVDECSMISLELFAELLKLLPPSCALILAGDRRQLPPVESGMVFSDLCFSGRTNTLLPAAKDIFNAAYDGAAAGCDTETDFSGFIVELQTNYRSAQAPTICKLAELLRDDNADIDHLVSEIVNAKTRDYTFVTLTKENYLENIREKCRIIEKLPELCSSGIQEDIERALQLSESFHFLCAVNRGEQGCANVNKLVLDELGITPECPGAWHPGTVLQIKVNDYRIGLNNGDVGIVTCELDNDGKKRLFCRFQSCPERRLHLGELPEHECGFALSIHKAQGQGYKEAVVILPGYNSEVLQRELIYTGITRASETLEVWGTPDEVRFALEQNETSSVNLFQRT